MSKLKVLELFSGTQSISKEFRKNGHKTLTVDYNPIFSTPDNEYGIVTDLTIDILDLTKEMIVEHLGGEPDIIWSSPDCTTFSVAAIYHHRSKEEDGNLAPKSDKARLADKVTKKSLEIISWFPSVIYFIENPRGALRKMKWMQKYPRYTVTYCQYGDSRQKPTDLWTNHPNPNFRPMCKPGAKCHVSAPRGSSTGTQGLKDAVERSRIPEELCKEVVHMSENFYQIYHTQDGSGSFDIDIWTDRSNYYLYIDHVYIKSFELDNSYDVIVNYADQYLEEEY